MEIRVVETQVHPINWRNVPPRDLASFTHPLLRFAAFQFIEITRQMLIILRQERVEAHDTIQQLKKYAVDVWKNL